MVYGIPTRSIASLCCLCACVLLLIGPAAGAMPRGVQAVQSAVVRIHVIEADYSSGRERKQQNFGSGVIISAGGYVVTNHHVAGNGKYFTCTLPDRSEIDAVLVGTDALTDLSVLQLKPAAPQTFPFAKFGKSAALRTGDRIYALGSPLAFDQSITEGVVSNTALSMPEIFQDDVFLLDGEDITSVVQWIGHDAAIYPGNSGGPLVNTRGEIVGINEVQFGLSGAIPGDLVRRVTQELITRGEVRRSWVGLIVQPLLESSPVPKGVLVAGALPDSPAGRAGFQAGDILLNVHGTPADARLGEDLPAFNQLLMSLPIDQPVQAVVWRAGKELALTMTPALRPKAKNQSQEFPQWGFCASNLTTMQSNELRRKGTVGVLIDSLRSGGPSDNAKPGLRQNDIIVEAAGQPIRSLDDLRAITRKLVDGSEEAVPVLVAVERGQERIRTVVEVGLSETPDPGLEVRKAWLPVGTQVLTRELARALGLEEMTGVCITQVYPNTTASKAGLQVGDIITALDGQSIPATRPEHIEIFPTMVRQYAIGTSAELAVIRNGEKQTITVELAPSPTLAREMKRYQNTTFEFISRNLTFYDRTSRGWTEDQAGALVESVTEGGWAALGHLQSGDVIIAIDGEPVPDITALETAMTRIGAARPRQVVVLIKRDGHQLFLEWRANWAITQ
ncbi:MAG: PDZ domain-containing protein [Armatimonadota bacterium]